MMFVICLYVLRLYSVHVLYCIPGSPNAFYRLLFQICCWGYKSSINEKRNHFCLFIFLVLLLVWFFLGGTGGCFHWMFDVGNWSQCVSVCVHVCVHARVRAHVYVCVCVRDRERVQVPAKWCLAKEANALKKTWSSAN